jgi:hypothetical protein
LSNRAEVTLDLSKITSGPMVHAEWMDPRSGERAAIGDFPTSGQPTFLPPETYEDAVLLLEGV